jgi:peptide/nickel transport system permease protein
MAAWHQDSAVDRLLSALALIGQSVPTFWVGLMAILVFAVQLQWLPSGGYGTLSQLVLPAVVLSLHPMAFMARITRSSSVEMMSEPFMMAATARGVPQRKVIFRHLLRNVTVPLLSVAGLQVAGLLSGVVTVELVFGWPGMGTLAVQAVQFKDFPLVEAIVVVSALVFVVSNLIVDILYGIVDPRVRTKH